MGVRPGTGRGSAWWLLAAGAAAFIIYGSLYPFRFQAAPEGAALRAAVLAALSAGPGGRGEVLANLLLYGPLGFALAIALARRQGVVAAMLSAAAACCLLSGSIEIAQAYTPGRTSSLLDLTLNAAGGTAGAFTGALAGRTAGRLRVPALRDGGAALLLGAWLAYRLYPYIPAMDRGEWIASMRPLVQPWHLDPVRVLRLAGSWLVACRLLSAAVPWRERQIAGGMMLAVLAAAVPIVNRALRPEDVVAAGLALALWTGLAGWRRADAVLLAVLLCVVLAEGLWPYRLRAVGRAFSWVPFAAMVGGQYAAGVQAGLLKLFLYGGLLWLAWRAGAGRVVPAVLVAALALAIGWAQTHLPGRSGETTDAALALIAALVLWALHPRDARDARAGGLPPQPS
jgi:VanZ family protein